MRRRILKCILLVFIVISACSCNKAEDEINTTNTTEVTTEHIMGQTTLTYIGHASVKIVSASGKVIYIDPNYEYDYSDKADFILVTHGHSDHQPLSSVKLTEDGIKITYKESLIDGTYYSFDYGDIKIQAVPASNANHNINFCVGYIVTVDGIKIYHAGDTSMLSSMEELSSLNIDYALYPIDGIYNMDAAEATDVANLVNATYNIPIHENDSATTHKSDNFLPNGRLVLEYGQTIVIKEE